VSRLTLPDPTSDQQRILAVDDAPDILTVVGLSLETEGFDVVKVASAQQALDWISRHGLPHLAVVDVMMPGMDGLEFCRRVQKFSDLPVILLTSVDDEDTVVHSIEELAEDYITKPFNPRELAARVKRVLRRFGDFSYALAPKTVIDDQLAVDFAHQSAEVAKGTVDLTPTETKLLYILIRSAHRPVSTQYLLSRLWPMEEVFEDALRVHIHRLRHKIEPNPSNPRYLVTQRGVGYAFLP